MKLIQSLLEIQKITEVLNKHTFGGFINCCKLGLHRKTLFWLLKHKMFILDVIIINANFIHYHITTE